MRLAKLRNSLPSEIIVRADNGKDTVYLDVFSQVEKGLIDGGAGDDTLDLSSSKFGVRVRSLPTKMDNEALQINVIGSNHHVVAYNFENLIFTKGNDIVKIDNNDVPHLKVLNTGNGNDTVDSSVKISRLPSVTATIPCCTPGKDL